MCLPNPSRISAILVNDFADFKVGRLEITEQQYNAEYVREDLR